jgi:3-hydroxyisobutyrate dehydrogenase-like beta-hydroxyacid dehydrogenase
MESGLKRNITALCEDAGVHRSQFYRWMESDAAFRGVWESLWRRMVNRHFPTAVAAAVEKAQRGDVSAVRLMAELLGVLKQQVEQTGTQRVEIEYTNNWRNTYEAEPTATASGADARDAASEEI